MVKSQKKSIGSGWNSHHKHSFNIGHAEAIMLSSIFDGYCTHFQLESFGDF